jgi:hypothetical protein
MPCYTVLGMADITPRKLSETVDQVNIRTRPEDMEILAVLRQKLGVDNSQIFRLAIRVLATKEGVAA